jgi:hypothetical protein
MNRFGLLLLGGLAASSALPASAMAQTLPTTPTVTTAFTSPLVVRRDGSQLKNESIVYGTLADCDNNREFTFTVDAYSATAPVVEAWLGVGSSDCSTAANRTRSTSTVSRPVCKLLGTVTATSKPVLKARAKDIFSQNWPPLDGSEYTCDQVKDQKYIVYVIPLAQKTNLEGSSATEPTPIGSIGVLKAIFTVFTEPPTAPGNVDVQPGQRELGVTFDTIAGTIAKTQYKAYYDYGTGAVAPEDAGVDEDATTDLDAGTEDAAVDLDAGADDAAAAPDAATDATVVDASVVADAAVVPFTQCGSGLLAKGARPPASSSPFLHTQTVKSGKSYMNDLDKKGIPLHGFVAVSVVTIDPAGNESVLTDPVCVERVETAGFLPTCEMDPKCKDGFDKCSVSAPGLHNGSQLGLSFLFGLGVALFVRRPRRAGSRASKTSQRADPRANKIRRQV